MIVAQIRPRSSQQPVSVSIKASKNLMLFESGQWSVIVAEIVAKSHAEAESHRVLLRASNEAM